MKSIVIYYSLTGNTKQIAEAIHTGISNTGEKCEIARLEGVDARELINHDLIGLGSFVSGFQEPAVITDFINAMPDLKGKYAFTFCTHGTCVGSYIVRTEAALREKGLTITGWNDWYGGVFIPVMPKPYYTDGHPDDIDLKEAEDFGKEIMERSQRISKGETQLIPELPEKEEYNKIYGVPPLPQEIPEEVGKLFAEISKFKPKLNTEKCKYPKCTICMDNCPTYSINLSESPPISYETCGPCLIWFCEQLCPTGAIEVDWEPIEKAEDSIKSHYSRVAKSMFEFKELRRFRSLITKEEGSDEPLFRRKKHPKLIMRDGILRERS